MVETDKLAWLRGPVPPMADSIMSCGLVSEHASVKKPTMLPEVSQVAVVSKPKKRDLRQKWKQKASSSLNVLQLKSAPLPEPIILPTYKPPPLVPEMLTEPKDRHVIPRTEKKVSVVDSGKKKAAFDIEGLQKSIDAKIAELFPVPCALDNAEQNARVRNGMLQIYNYALNEIIQHEKAVSTPKALFLLRIKEFYNSIVAELPRLVKSYAEEREPMVETIEELRGQRSYLRNQGFELQRDKEALEQELNEAKEANEKLTSESSEKDVKIAAMDYDNEYANGRIAQLTFRLNKKRERLRTLKKSIAGCDNEVLKQLGQIEELQVKVRDFQNGETGYIVMHREALAEVERLKLEIEQWKNDVWELENIPKADACVDTSDLPKKKQKGGSPKRKTLTTSLSTAMDESAKNDVPAMLPRAPIAAQRSIPKWNPLKALSGQVPNLSDILNNEAEPKDVCNITFADACAQTTVSMADPVREVVVVKGKQYGKNDKEIVERDRKVVRVLRNVVFKSPTGFVFDYEKMWAIPDLHVIVMPLLSSRVVEPIPGEPRILAPKCVSSVVKNEKPLLWGLQLIHCFLCDPFVRSREHNHGVSVEEIIVRWLENWFKAPALIRQGVADLTRICDVYHKSDAMIGMFQEVIEGKYTLAQVRFITAVYSFTCNQTSPGLDALSTMMIDPSNMTTKIDIRVAHKAMTHAFTEEMADICMEVLINTEDPMINYFDFLRHAAGFFMDHHQLIFKQAVDLLRICGCSDRQIIVYDAFEYFMMFVGHETEIKSHWKSVVQRTEERSPMICLADLLMACTEKDNLLMYLLQLPSLARPAERFRAMSSTVRDLFNNLLSRTCTVTYVAAKENIVKDDKMEKYKRRLKFALLAVDVGASIWYYRMLVMRIDHLLMKKVNRIPFNPKADPEIFTQLREYMDMSEKSAFALVSDNMK